MAFRPQGPALRAPASLDALADFLERAVRHAGDEAEADVTAVLGELPNARAVLRELAGDAALPVADLTLVDARPDRLELRGTATVLSQPGVGLAFGFSLTADGVALTDCSATVAEPGAMRLPLPGVEGAWLAVHHLSYSEMENGAGIPALDATLHFASGADDAEPFAVRVSRAAGPAGAPWTLVLADDTRPAGVADGLLALLGGGEVLGPLGGVLRGASGAVRLEELTLSVDPAAGRMQTASLALAAARDGAVRWSVIDGALAIDVRAVRARMDQPADAAERVVKGSLAGTVALGNADVDIVLDLAGGAWTLALAADAVALASPGQLLAMAGLSGLAGALPALLAELGGGGALHDLAVDLDPRAGGVRSLAATIDFPGGAIPALPAARITALRATLKTAGAADGGTATITCDGVLSLGGATFDLAAHVELGHGGSSNASLLATQRGPLPLAALLSVFGVDDALPGGIGTLRVEDATIAVGPAAGDVTMDAALSAPEPLAIPGFRGAVGDGTLHLARHAARGSTAYTATLALHMDASGAVPLTGLSLILRRGADDAAAEARIAGTLRVAGVEVTVDGTRPAEADAGWRVAGHLAGTGPSVADLVGDALPGSPPPVDLPPGAVRALDVAYDTATGAVTLEAETNVTVDLTRLAPADLGLPSAEIHLRRITLRADGEQSLALEGTAAGAEAWVNVRRDGSAGPWRTTVAIHAEQAPDLGPFAIIRDWIGPTTLVRLSDAGDVAWWNAAPRPEAFTSLTRDAPSGALLFDTTFHPRRTPLGALPLIGDLLPDEGLALRAGSVLDLSADVVRTPVDLKVLTMRRLGVGLRGTLASPEIVAEAECDFTIDLPGVQRSTLRFATGAAVAVRNADVGLLLDLKGEVGPDGALKTEMVPLDPDAPPARVAGFHPFGLRGITLGALALHYGQSGRAFRGWARIADARMEIEAVMEGPARSAFHFAAARLTLQNILDGFLDESSPALPGWLGDTGLDAVRLDWASEAFEHAWPGDDGGAPLIRRYEPGLRGMVRLSVFGCRAAARFNVLERRFAGSMDRVDLGGGLLTIDRSPTLPEPSSALPGARLTHAESEYVVLPGPFIECDFGGAVPTFALSARVTLLRALTLDVAARVDAGGFRFDFSQSVDYGVRFRVDLHATLPRPGTDTDAGTGADVNAYAVARVGGRIGFGIGFAGFDVVAVGVGVELALAGPRVSGVLRGEFTLVGQRMRFTVGATADFRSLRDLCESVLGEARRVGDLAVAFLKDVLKACVQLANEAKRACVAAAEAVVELGRQILGLLEDLGNVLRDVGEEIGSWFGSSAKRDRERAARERVRLAEQERRLRERIRDEEEQEALYRLAEAALLDAGIRDDVEARIRAYPATPRAGAINPIVQTPDWRAAGRGYYAERWRLARDEAQLRQQARGEFHEQVGTATRAHAELVARRAAAAALLAGAEQRVDEARQAMSAAEATLGQATEQFSQHEKHVGEAEAALLRAETAAAEAAAPNDLAGAARDAADRELGTLRDTQLAAALRERDAAVAAAAPWKAEAVLAGDRALQAAGELLNAETELRDRLEALRRVDRALEAADPGQWYAARNAAGARGLDEWEAAQTWRAASEGSAEERAAATASLLAGEPDALREEARRGTERLAERARELSTRLAAHRAEEQRRAAADREGEERLAPARAAADAALHERNAAATERDAAHAALAEAERRLLQAERERRRDGLASHAAGLESTLSALARRPAEIKADRRHAEAALDKIRDHTRTLETDVRNASAEIQLKNEKLMRMQGALARAGELSNAMIVYSNLLHRFGHPLLPEVAKQGQRVLDARAALILALSLVPVPVEPWLATEWPSPTEAQSYGNRVMSAVSACTNGVLEEIRAAQTALSEAENHARLDSILRRSRERELVSRIEGAQAAIDACNAEYAATLRRAREDAGVTDVLAGARETAEGRVHADALARLRAATGRLTAAEEALVAARAAEARAEAGRLRNAVVPSLIGRGGGEAVREEAAVRAALARMAARADAGRSPAVAAGAESIHALQPAVERWIQVVTQHAGALDAARDESATLHRSLQRVEDDARWRARTAAARREAAARRASAAEEWKRVVASGAEELSVLAGATEEALVGIGAAAGCIARRLPRATGESPTSAEVASLRDRFEKIWADWRAATSRASAAAAMIRQRPNLLDAHSAEGYAFAVRRIMASSLDQAVAATGRRLDALRHADAELAAIHGLAALRAHVDDARRLRESIAAAEAVAGELSRAAREAETVAATFDAVAAEWMEAAAATPDEDGITEVKARSHALVSAAAQEAADAHAMLAELHLLRTDLHEARLRCALLTDPEDGEFARLRTRVSELRTVAAATAAAYADAGELPPRDDTPQPPIPEVDATAIGAAVARAVVARRDFAESVRREVLEARAALAVRHPAYGRALEDLRRRAAEPPPRERLLRAGGDGLRAEGEPGFAELLPASATPASSVPVPAHYAPEALDDGAHDESPDDVVVLWSAHRVQRFRAGEQVAALDWTPTGMRVGAGVIARIFQEPGFGGRAQYVRGDLPALDDGPLGGRPRSLRVEALAEVDAGARWTVSLDGPESSGAIGPDATPHAPLVVLGAPEPRSQLHILPIAASGKDAFVAAVQSAWNQRFLDLGSAVPRFVDVRPADAPPRVDGDGAGGPSSTESAESAPWNALLGLWTGHPLQPSARLAAELAPPTVIVEVEADGAFALRDATGRYLCLDPATARFGLTGERESRARLRIVARVADSIAELGSIPQGTRALVEPDGETGTAYLVRDAKPILRAGLRARPAAARRDDAEWNAALAAAQLRAHPPTPDGAPGDESDEASHDLARVERVAALWTILQSMVDDVDRGWEMEAARRGLIFPEADLAAELAPHAAADGSDPAGPGRTDVVHVEPPRIDAHLTDGQADFWAGQALRELDVELRLRPIDGAGRQVVVEREGGFSVSIEDGGEDGTLRIRATVADERGTEHTFASDDLTLPAGLWSPLAIRWRAATGALSGRILLEVNGVPVVDAPLDAAALSPGTGPLTFGVARNVGATGSGMALRDVRIGDGGPFPIGDWPLDDGPGPWARDRSAAGQHGLALTG